MSPGLQTLSREDARERALVSLGLSQAATDRDVQLEVLRAAAWALTGGTSPVHILRLLNRSVEFAAGLARSAEETERVRAALREELDALTDVGDLVELDGGYWLPAPTRLVDAYEDDFVLLVGGLPTRAVSADVRQLLSLDGPFRRVDRQMAQRLDLPTEDLSDWARRPSEPLGAWSRRIIDLELPEYSAPRDGSVMQLYLPERARPGAPQFKRWVEHHEDATGRYLARRTRVFGAREYRVVEAADGRLVRSGAVLGPREARRLMYAFDAQCGNTTRARWMPRHQGGELVLTSDLPEPEHRILGAIGRLEPNSERVYERRWTFTKKCDQVLGVLSELSINVKEDGKARR